jgi:hypothetical protein
MLWRTRRSSEARFGQNGHFQNLMQRSMEMKLTWTGPEGKDTAVTPVLHMSFELGDKAWKLTLTDGRRSPSRFTVAAGDQAAVLECVAKVKARWGLQAQAPVYSCYEAGRDGWWLHRWLNEQGICTSWWILQASRCIGVRAAPRAIGSTATSSWRCCCATAAANGGCGR